VLSDEIHDILVYVNCTEKMVKWFALLVSYAKGFPDFSRKMMG
jgi:hypothetical protein